MMMPTTNHPIKSARHSSSKPIKYHTTAAILSANMVNLRSFLQPQTIGLYAANLVNASVERPCKIVYTIGVRFERLRLLARMIAALQNTEPKHE
jgi:hypothetical protein